MLEDMPDVDLCVSGLTKCVRPPMYTHLDLFSHLNSTIAWLHTSTVTYLAAVDTVQTPKSLMLFLKGVFDCFSMAIMPHFPPVGSLIR